MRGADPLVAFDRARHLRQKLNLTLLLMRLLTCLSFALLAALGLGYAEASRALGAQLYRECLDVQRELIAAGRESRTFLDCRR